MPDHQLDISSDPEFSLGITPAFSPTVKPGRLQRRFLGVFFQCCNAYSRVYLNRQNTAYAGNCPRCGKRGAFPIKPGGTDCRFFSAY